MLGALGRLSANPVINGVASLYVSLIRGTPLLVQIFVWTFAVAELGLVLPLFWAGIISLGVNYGAYMTEIFRAGIQAVPRGQREAAQALGMPERLIMRRIVLPQAFRIVIPAIGNDFIAMIKDTSLVFAIGIQELLFRANSAGRQTVNIMEALLFAAVVYWVLTHHLLVRPAATRAADGPERPLMELGDVVVSATGIEKYFGQNHVLRGVDLEVRQHETVMLIGRSGSGKTTMLRCLNFLEEPTIGTRPHRRHHGRWRTRCTAAVADTGSRSANCACAPAWCSRTSTCSRT